MKFGHYGKENQLILLILDKGSTVEDTTCFLGAESGASVGKAIYLSHLSYASFLFILVLKCRTYKIFNFVLLDA
jgi:hypothetical protein